MEWLEPADEKPVSSQQRYARVDTILNIFLRKLDRRLKRLLSAENAAVDRIQGYRNSFCTYRIEINLMAGRISVKA